MKKYEAPEILLVKYDLNESIAAVESTSCIDLDDDTLLEDKISFSDLIG